MNQLHILPRKLDCSLVSSHFSSPPVQPACRHLMTASRHLSQPSDLYVNRRHQQLPLTQHAQAHLQGKPSTNAFCIDSRLRLMAQLTNSLSAGVFTPDEVPSEMVPSPAIKAAFGTYSTCGWAFTSSR